jgi:hypothetical protein
MEEAVLLQIADAHQNTTGSIRSVQGYTHSEQLGNFIDIRIVGLLRIRQGKPPRNLQEDIPGVEDAD